MEHVKKVEAVRNFYLSIVTNTIVKMYQSRPPPPDVSPVPQPPAAFVRVQIAADAVLALLQKQAVSADGDAHLDEEEEKE